MVRILQNLVLFIALAVIVQACTSQDDQLLAPGISLDLANYRKERIENINYDLSFDIPKLKTDSITGFVTINFDLDKGADNENVILDFNTGTGKIISIEANGKSIDIQWEDEHLIIPADHLVKKTNTVEIAFIAGEQSLNRNDDFLYTLFVPDRASTCFPLFDQPDLKAKFKLSLTVPAGWKALANSDVEKVKTGNASTTYLFKQTPLISSYLFSFVVGDFQVITKNMDGTTMSMYHRETDTLKLQHNVDQIFEWHRKSISWLEAYTDMKLPFQKFDFALIPAFQYGGMEHPGAVLYNASAMLLDESSTLNQKLSRARLIAHETAHMWFGDLVTMKWFNDVWLKEVFANLMASKIVEPGFPDVNHDLKFLMTHYPAAYEVDRTRGTHAIEQPLNNLKQAGALYGAVIYQKAPIVMRMLEQGLGEEQFKTGLRKYLKEFAYDNASWDDLIQILAQGADFDVKKWNDQWVRTAGMPRVKYMIRSKRNNKITKFGIWSRNNKKDANRWWAQDLDILLGYPDSSAFVAAPLLTDRKKFSIKGLPYPTYLYVNGNGLGYGYFYMHQNSMKYLLEHIDTIEDPVLRASLWINFYESVLRRHLAPGEFIERVMKSLVSEKETLIVEYLTQVVQSVYWRILDNDKRATVAPKLEGLLLNMTLNEEQELKAAFFKAFRSVASTQSSITILHKLWNEEMHVKGLTLSENDLTNIAYELAVREFPDYDAILDKQEQRITNADRKERFRFVRQALSHHEADRDTFFESLKEPINREHETWVLEAISYLHHPVRASSAVKYIGPSLDMLQEIQLTGDIFFPKRWLEKTLEGHGSDEAAAEVKNFLYRNNNYPTNLKNKLLQSSDILLRSEKIRNQKN